MNKLKINPQSITFIDHHILTTGEIIDGNYPCALIDFPTYKLDKDSRILQGQMDFKINKNLIAIYGDGRSFSGDVGAGISTRLFGIYKLPFTSQGYDTPQLTVLNIYENGGIEIEYRNEHLTLQSGEKWEKKITEFDNFEQNEYKGTIKLILTDIIFNYGVLDKSNINKW